MRTKLFTLGVILWLSTCLAAQTSGTCGTNLTWTLQNGVLTISGTGAMDNYSSSSLAPWYSPRVSITSVIINNGATSIGNRAFNSLRDLTTVFIPNSVTTIGENAFSLCISLPSVTIPNSVTSIGDYAFSRCSSLTLISFGDSVTTIGEEAFSMCGMTSISIPSSVTSLGDGLFRGCNNLASVTIPNSVTSMGNSTFFGCSNLAVVSLSDSVTSIKEETFYNCSSLTTVSIPNTVTRLENNAFRGCFNLLSIIIPNGVTSIGDHAFDFCKRLTSITLPNSVTSIGDYAFSRCDSLVYISLSDSLANIGAGAFDNCRSLPVVNNLRYADYYLVGAIDTTLTSYTVRNGTTWIGEWAFYKCSRMTSVSIPNSVTIIDKYAFRECKALTTLTIPNSVTRLGQGLFFKSGLTSISIPSSVTSIGEAAFSACQGLTSIVLPNSLTRIERAAFEMCRNLTTAYIPGSVTSIGINAFGYCDSISDVYIYNPNPITITDITYAGRNWVFNTSKGNLVGLIPENLRIYVPCGSEEAYKTTQYWSDYASRIESFPFSYEIQYDTNDSIRGLVDASIPQSECDSAVVTAIPNEGYYFLMWSDNTTSNPYVLYATQDTAIAAIFEKNTYIIQTQVNNSLYGTTIGDTSAYYLDTVTITAIPNHGYCFSQWSDGNKDNPRTVIVTADSTFEAIFVIDDSAIRTVDSSSTLPQKILQNGQLYIFLPDGTKYSATGRKVE